VAAMFDDRVGSIIRAVRIRRGLRQVDVARLAFVSDATVSRIERGHLDELTLRVIRRVARALEIRMDLAPWSRGGDLHRFATAGHAELVESVLRTLLTLGWEARTEVSFSHAGERGFVDILAWHAETRTLLVIEIKTEIVDVGETLGTLDRKRRLASRIAAGFGWMPAGVSTALIALDTRTNRRRIRAHDASFRSLLPADGRRLRAFLRNPSIGMVGAAAFWTNRHPGSVRQRRGGTRRVRRLDSCVRRTRAGAEVPLGAD
jgi:transcriptional regulator with XRE-family HTH domain